MGEVQQRTIQSFNANVDARLMSIINFCNFAIATFEYVAVF